MQALTLGDTLGPLLNIPTLCAYLDPGTGSYALQLILAGAFGGMFAVKQYWQQCRTWFAQFRIDRRNAASTIEATD